MAVQVLNPSGLVVPATYVQVGIASGTRIVYLSGQIGQDAEGNLVGAGDLAAQTEQALLNVAVALQAAGATFADVAKITIYVVRWRQELLPALAEGLTRVATRLGIDPRRPTTLVGVESLFTPEVLVEFDVTAVLSEPS